MTRTVFVGILGGATDEPGPIDSAQVVRWHGLRHSGGDR